MRAYNQEKCKQSILLSLPEDKVFILYDWAMKFLRIKLREKQSEWFAKRGITWHLWEARGLLLRSPVEQLQPGSVRCSLNPRVTHYCLKNKPFNHYKGVPKIRRSGLLSQQQSPSGPPRCWKSSGN